MNEIVRAVRGHLRSPANGTHFQTKSFRKIKSIRCASSAFDFAEGYVVLSGDDCEFSRLRGVVLRKDPGDGRQVVGNKRVLFP